MHPVVLQLCVETDEGDAAPLIAVSERMSEWVSEWVSGYVGTWLGARGERTSKHVNRQVSE